MDMISPTSVLYLRSQPGHIHLHRVEGAGGDGAETDGDQEGEGSSHGAGVRRT